MNLRWMLILSTGFLACSDSPMVETNLNQIIVWSILSPQYETQTVLLGQGLNIVYADRLNEEDLSNPIRDATVVVKDGEQEVLLQEVEPGVYQDVEAPLEIEPGRTYHLEVSDGAGRIARAHTTVPGEFEIEMPANGAAIATLDSLVFQWQRSPHARRYEVGALLEPPCAPTDRGGYYYLANTRDTVATVRFFDFCTTESSRIQFRVTAYDTASAIYRFSLRNDLEVFSNIEGGKGIFGSLIWRSIDLFVQREHDLP